MSSTNKSAELAELRASIGQNKKARERLVSLFDPDSFVELSEFMTAGDAQAGVVAGYGQIEGGVVYAFSQDVTVNSGAVSQSHAKKIKKVYELAAKTGCPVVCIYDSNGAKLDEGNEMLSAYSEILMCSNHLSGVVPQIAVVLGTCAGVSAMLASSADFVVMSKKAELFMTAPFVAPAKGAGSAENAAKSGVASLVCEDEEMALAETRKLLNMLPQNNLSSLPLFDFAENVQDFDPAGCPKLIVKALADKDSVIELSKDFSEGIFTFLGAVAGITTAFVATSRSNPIDVDSCSKAARFVKICDAFNIPVVTLMNSAGFELSADLHLVKEAAALASAYAEATTPKISIITGKATGSAYIALASKNSGADISYAWPQAQISALAPETAVEFLWADKYKGAPDVKAARAKLVEEYINTEASPFTAAKGGFIEGVIAPEETRKLLANTLDMLAGKRESKLPKKHVTL